MKTTKRILALLVCLLMVLEIMPVSAVPAFAEEIPDEVPEGYTGVYTVEDLFAVRYGLSGQYILMADIDLTDAIAKGGDWDNGYGWTPIGENASAAFRGVFDGNGHTIQGLRITGANAGYVGLFGYIDGGTVENLKLTGVDIDLGTANKQTGAVCGYAKNVTLTKLSVEGTVNAPSSDNVGGLIGRVDTKGNISLCYNKAAVAAANYVGGMAGYCHRDSNTDYITIKNCYNTGMITAKSNYAGGILGRGAGSYWSLSSGAHSISPSLQSCINLGAVSGTSFGSITGKETDISKCYYLSGTAATGKYDTTDTATTAIKLTAAQMKLKAVFGLLDFDTVWFLDTSTGCNYPQLIANPEAKPVEKIELKSTPEKTTYYQHDEIDVSGGVISVTYKMDFAPEDIPITADMLSGFDMGILGEQTVTITLRGATDTFKINVLEIPVASVSLNKSSCAIDIGKTETLSVTVHPENATYKDITWTSDDESIATVDVNGTVTAVSKGIAVITATAKSGAKADCVVTVLLPATSVSLDKENVILNEGDTYTFTTSLTPADSTDTYTFSSSSEDIATVSDSGVITAVSKGTAVITVTTFRGVSANCIVTVLRPATGITLDITAKGLERGEAFDLKATVSPSDTTDVITWSSSVPEVASVSNAGKVTAMSGGTAIITATTDSGKKAECTVFVLVPATAIYLDETEISLVKGENFTLTATVAPADSNDTYTWSTSDASVVSVKDGNLTALKAGTATVSVTTSRGKTAVCSVKVIVPATGVSLNKTTADVDINKTLKLTATLSPADCTDKVAWSSSDENIVTVAADGTVTAKAKGSTTVTATAESGENASCVITVLVPAASVSVSPDFVELEENGTAELTVALTPADTTDTYTWVSSDESIAAVDANGNVTATGRGTVTISAVTSRGVKGDCTVKIRFPADSITLADSDIKLDITKTAKLAATLLPAGANDVITWTSSDDSVVSVASDGTVTALKNGTATITAKIENGETAECKVTVLVPAEKAELDAEELSLNVGEEKTLTASLTPVDSTDTYTWSSSDPSVATVENGKVTAVAKGTAVITVTTSRGLTAECTVTVLVPAESVSFDLTEKKLDVNGSFRLTASIQPANSTDNITYSSSNTSVATVDANGTVKAVGKGTATITAKTASGKTATCTVTVLLPASEIALDSASISLNVGENKTLTASLTPADTTDTYTWFSSSPAVATVENGKVTAVAKGTAVITVTTSRGLTAKCTVTVLVPSTSVKFDVTSKNVNAGGSFKLTASMQPANSTDSITYSSSNTAVVTVASDGTVKAVGKGTATITAKTASGKTATCTVTVLLPATGITLNKTSASMKTGESLTLTATLTPAGSTDSVTWKTSNAKVATVSGGTVKAVGAGSATITATTASGKSASCNVSVAQSVTGVTLNKTEHSVTKAGQYLQLTATVSPANAANKAVTWSSDNTKVATVDSNGKVTIIGFGVANITVKTADGNKTATCKITALGIKLGDVDKDEKITAADARLALRRAVGLENYPDGSDQFLRCDVDSDKKVTAADARLILRAAVGLEKLPEGGGHDHIYNTAAKTVAPTCTAEGYISNVCMICKQTIKSNTTKALGHSWKAATCTAPKTCTRCGAKEGSALGHNYRAATCTAPKICNRCGETAGSALGHYYVNGRCARCGANPEATITLPTLPKTIFYGLTTSTRVDSISISQKYYSYDNHVTVTVYLSGECVYNSKGSGQSSSMKIGWKLYDSEGYVVDSGTAYSDAVKMGEKYKTDFIIFDLSPNESYRLEFLNVN